MKDSLGLKSLFQEQPGHEGSKTMLEQVEHEPGGGQYGIMV